MALQAPIWPQQHPATAKKRCAHRASPSRSRSPFRCQSANLPMCGRQWARPPRWPTTAVLRRRRRASSARALRWHAQDANHEWHDTRIFLPMRRRSHAQFCPKNRRWVQGSLYRWSPSFTTATALCAVTRALRRGLVGPQGTRTAPPSPKTPTAAVAKRQKRLPKKPQVVRLHAAPTPGAAC